MKYNAKYLRITMHDNDFTFALQYVAEILYKIFQDEGRYPEENELDLLKKYIEDLWFSIHNIEGIMRWNKNNAGFIESDKRLFKHKLEFVDYLDISYNDNWESVYIPMFNNAEILVR